MAKKKAKVLKTLTERFKVKRTSNWKDYEFYVRSSPVMAAWWPQDTMRKLFGRVLCAPGKTATVKITIEVEKIE